MISTPLLVRLQGWLGLGQQPTAMLIMMISGFLVRLACRHSEFEKMFINCVNCGRTLDAPLSALAGFTVSGSVSVSYPHALALDISHNRDP
jgi:hypothetical protein